MSPALAFAIAWLIERQGVAAAPQVPLSAPFVATLRVAAGAAAAIKSQRRLPHGSQREIGPWDIATPSPSASRRGRRRGLPALLEGAQVELVGPGRLRLGVERPVRLGQAGEPEHPVVAEALGDLGEALLDLLAADRAVDDDVGDVDTLRPPVAGQGLGEAAERELRRREGREGRARLAATPSLR